jgi:hypothetical protein
MPMTNRVRRSATEESTSKLCEWRHEDESVRCIDLKAQSFAGACFQTPSKYYFKSALLKDAQGLLEESCLFR